MIAALNALKVKRIAILDPYYPVIQPSLESFFGEFGFEAVRFVHMRGEQLTELSRVSSSMGIADRVEGYSRLMREL